MDFHEEDDDITDDCTPPPPKKKISLRVRVRGNLPGGAIFQGTIFLVHIILLLLTNLAPSNY